MFPPTHPYAIVHLDSPEYDQLIKIGWIMTDSYPSGWAHLEPSKEK